MPLTRFRGLDPGTVALLSGDPTLEGFDLADAVFLDTETTGLAGGTGTAAFLVGIGYVEGDRFRVRQYFMRDYHEEAALLRGLAEDLARFRHLVTFNGKVFDIPLLESRYAMNRERFPLAGARHFDLLFPARRLWKARLESCRLQVLEAALLGFRRIGDVAGAEIPNIYFDFVRRRDGRAMARVLQHNRLDIVSLAALAALAGQWVEGGRAEDPRDVFALAGLYERAALFDQSEAHYRRLVLGDAGPVRVPALLRLADRAKRNGDFSVALPLWEEAADCGDWWAVRELARHHEHRSRDLEKALALVDRGLDQILGALRRALARGVGLPPPARTIEHKTSEGVGLKSRGVGGRERRSSSAQATRWHRLDCRHAQPAARSARRRRHRPDRHPPRPPRLPAARAAAAADHHGRRRHARATTRPRTGSTTISFRATACTAGIPAPTSANRCCCTTSRCRSC